MTVLGLDMRLLLGLQVGNYQSVMACVYLEVLIIACRLINLRVLTIDSYHFLVLGKKSVSFDELTRL